MTGLGNASLPTRLAKWPRESEALILSYNNVTKSLSFLQRLDFAQSIDWKRFLGAPSHQLYIAGEGWVKDEYLHLSYCATHFSG